MERETVWSAQCAKSISLTKVIDTPFLIGLFEYKCVIIKGLMRSELLKQHIDTIVIDQSLSNSDLYEHNFFEISRSYTNLLINVTINEIIKLLLMHEWFPTLEKYLKSSNFT